MQLQPKSNGHYIIIILGVWDGTLNPKRPGRLDIKSAKTAQKAGWLDIKSALFKTSNIKIYHSFLTMVVWYLKVTSLRSMTWYKITFFYVFWRPIYPIHMTLWDPHTPLQRFFTSHKREISLFVFLHNGMYWSQKRVYFHVIANQENRYSSWWIIMISKLWFFISISLCLFI